MRAKNDCSNLAWALIITARARILLHKLVQDVLAAGLEIYMVNTDELIVLEAPTLAPLTKTWGKQLKIRRLSPERLDVLETAQVNLVFKRERLEGGQYRA